MMFPSNPATADQIRKIDPNELEKTTADPVQHWELVQWTQALFAKKKLQPLATRYYLSGDNIDFALNVDCDPSLLINTYVPGYNFTFGLMSSLDGKKSMTFYCGLTEQNQKHGLAFAPVMVKKHSSRTVMREVMLEAFEAWLDECRMVAERHEEFSTEVIDQRIIDHVLMEACRGSRLNCFHWSKLGYVDDILSGVKVVTKWELVKAFATVLRTLLPYRQMDIACRLRVKLTEVGCTSVVRA